MPASTIVKTKRDGTLTFTDNLANSLTVEYEAGDFSMSVPGPSVSDTLDRGVMTGALRYTDDAPITATFTAFLRDISDASWATLSEIIMQSGDVGSNWESTLGPNSEVFTLDLLWTVAGSSHGDPNDHTVGLGRCVVNGSLSEGDRWKAR